MKSTWFKLRPDSVPWGFTSRTPGNHDGPGYTSSLPVNYNYDITDPAPQPGPTPLGVSEQAHTTDYASQAAEMPVPLDLLPPYVGKTTPLLPVKDSGMYVHGDIIFRDDNGLSG
jgi:hypothetical protein